MYGQFLYNNYPKNKIDNKNPLISEINTFLSYYLSDIISLLIDGCKDTQLAEIVSTSLVVPPNIDISSLESSIVLDKRIILSLETDTQEFATFFDSFSVMRQTVSSYTIPAILSASTLNRDVSNQTDIAKARQILEKVLELLNDTFCNYENLYTVTIANKVYKTWGYTSTRKTLEFILTESNKNNYTSAISTHNFEIFI